MDFSGYDPGSVGIDFGSIAYDGMIQPDICYPAGGASSGDWGPWTTVDGHVFDTWRRPWDGLFLHVKNYQQRVTLPKGFRIQLAVGGQGGSTNAGALRTIYDSYIVDCPEWQNESSPCWLYLPFDVPFAPGTTQLWIRGQEQTVANNHSLTLSIRPKFSSMVDVDQARSPTFGEWVFGTTGMKADATIVYNNNGNWGAWTEITTGLKRPAIFLELHVGNNESTQNWGTQLMFEVGLGQAGSEKIAFRRFQNTNHEGPHYFARMEPWQTYIPPGVRVSYRAVSSGSGTIPTSDINFRFWYA